jgi:hypothetical protein
LRSVKVGHSRGSAGASMNLRSITACNSRCSVTAEVDAVWSAYIKLSSFAQSRITGRLTENVCC